MLVVRDALQSAIPAVAVLLISRLSLHPSVILLNCIRMAKYSELIIWRNGKDTWEYYTWVHAEEI